MLTLLAQVGREAIQVSFEYRWDAGPSCAQPKLSCLWLTCGGPAGIPVQVRAGRSHDCI